MFKNRSCVYFRDNIINVLTEIELERIKNKVLQEFGIEIIGLNFTYSKKLNVHLYRKFSTNPSKNPKCQISQTL